MKIKDQSQEIKESLKAGGLVICGHGCGKTKALAEIVVEDPEAVVIVGLHAQRSRLIEFLIEMGLDEDIAKRKVLYSVDAGMYPNKINNRKVYVDEYFQNGYRGSFFAAVGTSPFPIKFIQWEVL